MTALQRSTLLIQGKNAISQSNIDQTRKIADALKYIDGS